MSRCFPFPPPGYKKKPRPDDANLLVELKEKKHKEEKKDKDKKERKEKRDREKSEEKRREKKEKKHKPKNDKERDKERKKNSEQKKVLVTSEHQNGGKPSPIDIQGTDSQQQFLLELEKRLRNEDGATENGRDEKIVAGDKGSISLQGKFTESKEKPKDKSEDHRMVNGHAVRVVATGLETGVVSSFMGEDQEKVEGGGLVVEKVDDKQKERKEKKKHRDTNGNRDKHQDRDQNKQHKSKNEKAKEKEEKSKEQIKQSSIDTEDIHANGSLYIFNESSWSKENLGKRKEPETNGVLHGSESRSCKKSRPVSLSHQVVQHGSKCDASQNLKVDTEVSLPQSFVENGQRLNPGLIVDGFISEQKSIVNNHKVQNSLSPTCFKLESCQAAMNSTNSGVISNYRLKNKVSSLQPVGENQQRLDCSQPNINIAVKREAPFYPSKVDDKKYVINGRTKTLEPVKNKEKIEKWKSHLHHDSKYLNQILTVDNKVSSSQSVVVNQVKSDCSQLNIHTAVERQGPLCAPQVDNKEFLINGLIKTQELKKIKEKVETQETPPHPDSKYLSQMLTVPEVEWSGYDDQAWLFSSDESKEKKPRTDTSQIDETQQVWAEALQMDSADIVALPYVIPY